MFAAVQAPRDTPARYVPDGDPGAHVWIARSLLHMARREKPEVDQKSFEFKISYLSFFLTF